MQAAGGVSRASAATARHNQPASSGANSGNFELPAGRSAFLHERRARRRCAAPGARGRGGAPVQGQKQSFSCSARGPDRTAARRTRQDPPRRTETIVVPWFQMTAKLFVIV